MLLGEQLVEVVEEDEVAELEDGQGAAAEQEPHEASDVTEELGRLVGFDLLHILQLKLCKVDVQREEVGAET